MGDEFSDYDLDTPTEADLDLAYGSKYVGSIDLGDRKVRSRIQKVRKKELTDKDGRKRVKFILFHNSFDKPLVLNSTNKDELVKALGRTPAKWIGADVGVFVDPNVSFAGRRTGGIRLRVLEPARMAKAPSPLPPSPLRRSSGRSRLAIRGSPPILI
jgi:hypothetical protein